MTTEPQTADVPPSPPRPIPAFFHALVRPRGDKRWDIFLRGTAAAALALIPIAIFFPDYAALVWLAVVGLPANGPLGPVLPTAFEPVMWEAAKYHPAIQVALVSLAVYMYMEYLNWHIYGWILSFQKLEKLRSNKWTQKGVKYFNRSPFLTISVWAVLPAPFWVCRCLALLGKYPVKRFLVATMIGRFPRMYLYAWLGERLRIPTPILIGIAVGGALVLVVWRLIKGRKVVPEILE
jgi:hypothetical protein